MAITKDIENEFGANFFYHKLQEVRIINTNNGVQLALTVYSWIDKQARIDGKKASVRKCIINNADFALTSFYALLKAKFPEFSDGENDFDNDFKGNVEAGDVEFFDQTADGKLFRTWKEEEEQ